MVRYRFVSWLVVCMKQDDREVLAALHFVKEGLCGIKLTSMLDRFYKNATYIVHL